MNRRQIGSQQECIAIQYLEENGYQVEEQNYWTRFSEIDIVAREAGYLCFVEVKYRANARYGAPEGVITPQKMRRIGKAAQYYLYENGILPDTPIRFDVVMIVGETITLYKNAFGAKM